MPVSAHEQYLFHFRNFLLVGGMPEAGESLHQFVALKSCSRALRFDLNTPSHTTVRNKAIISTGTKDIEYELLNLPLYMAEQAFRLLEP